MSFLFFFKFESYSWLILGMSKVEYYKTNYGGYERLMGEVMCEMYGKKGEELELYYVVQCNALWELYGDMSGRTSAGDVKRQIKKLDIIEELLGKVRE